jgi:hypothetical protein
MNATPTGPAPIPIPADLTQRYLHLFPNSCNSKITANQLFLDVPNRLKLLEYTRKPYALQDPPAPFQTSVGRLEKSEDKY